MADDTALLKPTHRKDDNVPPFQKDMRIGWLVMLAYWTVCALVGRGQGYYDLLAKPQPVETFQIMTLVVTLMVRMALNPRYGRFGRRVDWLAIVMYSLMNGVLETFAFLFAYDLGRHLHVEYLFGWHNKNDELIGFLIGFSIYYVYAGLIHIVVWMRMVFPQHVLHESAPPFHTHCLPFLTLQSIAWLVLYEATNDVFFICLCHCITDMGHAWTCAMPYTTWNANGAFLLRE